MGLEEKMKEYVSLNEFEMAKIAVMDKHNSLAKLHEESGVSISRIKDYRCDPDKMLTSKWITVHNLANVYRTNTEALWT